MVTLALSNLVEDLAPVNKRIVTALHTNHQA